MRAGDLRPERRPGVGPHVGAEPGFQVSPARPHDRLVERDERLGDVITGPPGPEDIGLPGYEAGVLQHVERVRDVGRLTADVAGDAAPRLVTGGDRGQDRMVERRIPDVRLLGEEVPCLAEQRAVGVEHRPHDPVVEVIRAGRSIVADELPTVGRRAADDRVQARGEPRITQPPEPGRVTVAERLDDHLQAGPPAQRRVARQQAAHHGHGRTAEQDARAAGTALRRPVAIDLAPQE